MLSETFYIDGVDAKSVGIHLQRQIEFSEAVPVIESQSVPGRNGDLIWDTGSYENRSGVASCFCLQKDVEKAISSAGRFFMGKRGYRRLETSDDPDHFWLARVENSPQISMRLRTLAPFEIGFDCKPQRFLKSGEEILVFNEFGSVFNQYCQVALPLITVCYRGDVVLNIGDCEMGFFGLWYEEDLLSELLVNYNGFSIKDLRDWRVEQAGATPEQFMTALNDCGGDIDKMFSDLSASSGISEKTLEMYIGYKDRTWKPAVSDFLASDWEHSITLDSDVQNAYNNSGDQNSAIYAPTFPAFKTGETKISWNGNIRTIKIVPRWWEL